jgi:spermidine/putrescine ABC transporter ATP-binding subunit
MSSVRFEQVVKKYGDLTALESLDLDIGAGEFLTLLGPSGCGKTTTLRLIAGFITPTNGQIFLDDMEITHLAPQDRNVGMVFQDYALFPHMTIAENIAFGLVERGVDKVRTRARVEELLELIEMPDVGERHPAQLSGGQQQRVAVARAVAYAPSVLLMDEPLGALDLKLRESMQIELKRIQRELGITAVYVTHDQSEAMNMSDRIAVMNRGVLEQIGSAEEIYDHPRTKFVAGFVGQINFLECKIVECDGDTALVEACATRFAARGRGPFTLGTTATAALRPERLTLGPPGTGDSGDSRIEGTIEAVTFAGNLVHTTVRVGDGPSLMVESRPGEVAIGVGEAATISWSSEHCLLLRD